MKKSLHILFITSFFLSANLVASTTTQSKIESLKKTLKELRAKVAKLKTQSRLNLIPQICQIRLSLDSSAPVLDVNSSSHLYLQPYQGDRCALYSGSDWLLYAMTTINIDLTTANGGGAITSGKNYDVFLYSNSGTPTPALVEWTGDSTRATALALQDGVYVLSGTPSKRYLGTIRANASGATTDTTSNRFVWNYCNTVRRSLQLTYSGSWNPTSSTDFHIANTGLAAVTLNFVLGLGDSLVRARAVATINYTDTTIGIDVASDLVNAAQIGGSSDSSGPSWVTNYFPIESEYKGYLPAGYNTIRWIEFGAHTVYGDTGDGYGQSGLAVELEN